MTAEGDRIAGFGRLEDGLKQAGPWYTWGPYVSERQWGTVREDYSEDGDAWNYLSHDQARSRAYRWGEDGLAGFCDVEQRLCLGLALWNGRDPYFKERLFGLTGPEGNHGEDVKEYWWYLDAVPSHAWNRWRYHYPQAAFPYDTLRQENARRDRRSPEYELMDTGIFDDDRYWITEVTYAKSDDAAEVLMLISVTNPGPDTDTVHVLPTAWFRNTWSWDHGAPKPVLKIPDNSKSQSAGGGSRVRGRCGGVRGRLWWSSIPFSGRLSCSLTSGRVRSRRRCCSARTRAIPRGCSGVLLARRTRRTASTITWCQRAATVNPGLTGTKCSFWYRLTVEPGGTAEIRLRLRPYRYGRRHASVRENS